jgi:hypothetical protein
MPGAPTAGRRRRRGLTLVRLAAYASPIVVLASAFAAASLQGWWLIAGLATAILVSGSLAAIVLYLERRTRTAVAATRAKMASQHNADHARYSEEHRSFTAHMISLLDGASVRIAVLRRRVDSLEREIATTRFLQQTRPVLAHELSAFSKKSVARQWPEMWPDLAEAPTVVDFVAWDQRSRTEGGDGGPLLAGGSLGPGGAVDDAYADDRDDGEQEQRSA